MSHRQDPTLGNCSLGVDSNSSSSLSLLVCQTHYFLLFNNYFLHVWEVFYHLTNSVMVSQLKADNTLKI